MDTIKNIESKLGILKIDSNVKNEIRSVVTSNISRNLKSKVALTPKDKLFEQNLKLTKAFIKNHKEKIFFAKADEGNVTVCMKVDEYKEKMKLLLNDRHTYKIEKRNSLTRLQNKVEKFNSN